MRSKYLLMVSPKMWTPSQRERAEILFELYPDIEMAYSLTLSLRMSFAQKCDKEAGRKSIKKRYAKVGEFDNKAFNDIAAAMYDRETKYSTFSLSQKSRAMLASAMPWRENEHENEPFNEPNFLFLFLKIGRFVGANG